MPSVHGGSLNYSVVTSFDLWRGQYHVACSVLRPRVFEIDKHLGRKRSLAFYTRLAFYIAKRGKKGRKRERARTYVCFCLCLRVGVHLCVTIIFIDAFIMCIKKKCFLYFRVKYINGMLLDR